MRSVVFAFTFTLYLVLCVPVAEGLDIPQCPSPQTCDNDPGHLEAFVKSFYTWYVVSTFENMTPWTNKIIQEKLKESLTVQFFKIVQRKMHASEPDIEPIICAQDYYDAWVYPAAHITDMKNASGAKIAVSFPIPVPPEEVRKQPGYRPEPLMHQLEVTLKVEQGKWLIDAVGGQPCEPYHGR